MIAGTNLRLLVLRVLVISLLVTLGARLYYLQVLDKNKLKQTANDQHSRQVVLPAPRGSIVDDVGRQLADNRTELVIAIDRDALQRQPNKGVPVLRRLSGLIDVPTATLKKEITLCTRGVPKPCWTGSPVQPVPVKANASAAAVLRISEHREDFPGVIVDSQAVRQYPTKQNFGHETGYVGAVDQAEIDAAASEGKTLYDEDTTGRNGLEQSYDSALRGSDGVRTVSVDNTGAVTGTISTKPPVPGDTLVTSLDANVQKVAIDALRTEITKKRATYDPKTHKNFAATSGAVVVMDPMTGRIVGLASYPNYDPNEFIGGITQSELNSLNDNATTPMVSRAVQGQYAPGSTFKLSTASAITMDHQLGLDQTAACPPSLQVGNQQKTNYDSESLPGQITLGRALAFSCDTFFYKFAMDGWNADQARVSDGKKPVEALQAMARAYGFGSKPDIDLPIGAQTSGQIVDRAFLKKRWDEDKAQYCSNAKKGYPQVADPVRRAYLTELAKENCTDGWRFRIGEAADMAIGQGETTVSPLQLAVAYSALVNGGKIYEPTIGKAVVDPQGKVVRTITPKVKDTVPVSQEVLDYIKNSLKFGTGQNASGEIAFPGFPFDKYPVSGKTGTAEVYGKQDTSWFASWSHNGDQHYVVVGMVSEAGTGATAAAPVVHDVYNGIYGLTKGAKPDLPDGKLPPNLPTITPYGNSFPGGDIVGPDVPATSMPGANPTALALTPDNYRRVKRRA